MEYQIRKKVNEFTNTVSRSLSSPFSISKQIGLHLIQKSSPNGETIYLYFTHSFGEFNDMGDEEPRIFFQNGFVVIRLNDLENIKLMFQEKDKVDSWSSRVNMGGYSSTHSYQGESNYVILDEETLKKISYSHTVAMWIEGGTGTYRNEFNAQKCGNFNVYCKTLYDELYGANLDNGINDTPTGTGMNYSNADSNQKKADASVGSKKQNEGYSESYLEYMREKRRYRILRIINIIIIIVIVLSIYFYENQ